MVFERIQEVVAGHMDLEKDAITMESRFVEDIGADSLDVLQLITELEEAFNIEFEPSELEQMKTVADVVKHIEAANG